MTQNVTKPYHNQNWLPNAFSDFFDIDHFFRGGVTAPAINVIESDTDYKVEVAAPGMNKDDFKICLDENGDLSISMEKQAKSQSDDEKTHRYLRREFSYTKFRQTLSLPDNVERDRISASVVDGILSITLPKMTEEEKQKASRFIEVQ